jgi:Ran GTPase-activating protein (RanGAP) involved in mRNA processing and transport
MLNEAGRICCRNFKKAKPAPKRVDGFFAEFTNSYHLSPPLRRILLHPRVTSFAFSVSRLRFRISFRDFWILHLTMADPAVQIVVFHFDGCLQATFGGHANIALDLTEVEDEGLSNCLAQVRQFADNVKSVRVSRSPLSPKQYITLLSAILQDREFRNLQQLDLSYVNLPEICLNFLREYLSPVTGGYNITNLNVTRCNLGMHGATRLLSALFANNTITDLNLTGNNIEDGSLPTMVTMLTKYTNQIQTVGLGANNLTSAGILALIPVLQAPASTLRTLLLPNNPDIGDTALEELFVALNKGGTLTTLSLSNCGIQQCEWARYLPFMSKLATLDLSHNLVDDGEFAKLCKALEQCYCLSHLRLGHNRFGGVKSSVIEQMLRCNGGLHSLSLCGNRCDDAVWAAIYRGLLHNKVLLDLDLTECNITLPNALVLCRAFEGNDTCSLQLANNPLPAAVVEDPRGFYSAHWQKQQHSQQKHRIGSPSVVTPVRETMGTPSGENRRRRRTATDTDAIVTESQASTSAHSGTAAPLPLNLAAHAHSVAHSRRWCEARRKEISLSLNSLSIVADRKPHIAALNNPEEDNLSFVASLAAESASRHNDDGDRSGATSPTKTTRGALPGVDHASPGRNHSSNTMHTPTDKRTTTATGTSTRTGISITSPEIIAQSELYLSPHALRELVAASDLANTSEKRLMHVAYGRAPLVIGHIELTSLTTYAQVVTVCLTY